MDNSKASLNSSCMYALHLGEGSCQKSSPAWMNRAHGRWRKVRVVFNGDSLLNMVLADVLIHLLHSQRLPVLRNRIVSCH